MNLADVQTLPWKGNNIIVLKKLLSEGDLLYPEQQQTKRKDTTLKPWASIAFSRSQHTDNARKTHQACHRQCTSKHLRADSTFRDIKIIARTSLSPSAPTTKEAQGTDIKDISHKPFRMKDLVKTVRKLAYK